MSYEQIKHKIRSIFNKEEDQKNKLINLNIKNKIPNTKFSYFSKNIIIVEQSQEKFFSGESPSAIIINP